MSDPVLAHTPVTALINGVLYSNWTRYSVAMDVLQPCSSWSLSLANPTKEQVALIQEGASLSLMWKNQLLLRGYVDQRTLAISRDGSELTLDGRDHTAPLADCSIWPETRFANVSLVQVARSLCAQLGITAEVQAVNSEANEVQTTLEPEERFWGFLERCARRQRLMVWAEPGVIKIGRPTYTGLPVGTLRHYRDERRSQNNLLKAHYEWDLTQRRSPIRVMGRFGEAGSTLKDSATDSGLGLLRPLLIQDHDVDNLKEAQARAAYERDSRAGRRWRALVDVVGHGPTPESLWRLNTLVKLEDDQADIAAAVWIQAATFTRARDAGTTTNLHLRELDSVLPPLE